MGLFRFQLTSLFLLSCYFLFGPRDRFTISEPYTMTVQLQCLAPPSLDAGNRIITILGHHVQNVVSYFMGVNSRNVAAKQ